MLISYELLGKLFIYLVITVIIVTGIALLFGAYSIGKHKIIFPNYILFMLYLFYSPAKWICRIFSIKEEGSTLFSMGKRRRMRCIHAISLGPLTAKDLPNLEICALLS